jgi:hypothetical protein
MNTLDVHSTSVTQYGVFSAGQTGAGQPVSGEGTDFDSLLEPEVGQSSNAENSGTRINCHNVGARYIVSRMSRPKTPPPSLIPRTAPKGLSQEEYDKFRALTHQLTVEFYTKFPTSGNTIPEWYTDLAKPGVPIEYVDHPHILPGFEKEGPLPLPHAVGEMGDMFYEYQDLLRQAMDQALNRNGIAEDDWVGYERAVTNADTSERIRHDVLAILAANPRAVELMDTLKIKA